MLKKVRSNRIFLRFKIQFVLAIPNEIDEYLCHVIFQIYIGQINRPSDKIHHHLRKIYLKDKKQMKIYQLLNVISSSDKQNEVCKDFSNYFYNFIFS